MKKVRKTTRPFRYDLNQISYDYTVEVTNRFKGLDLIQCLKNYGWRFMTLKTGGSDLGASMSCLAETSATTRTVEEAGDGRSSGKGVGVLVSLLLTV